MIIHGGAAQVSGEFAGKQLLCRTIGDRVVFGRVPVFQIAVDIGPAASITPAPWTNISAAWTTVPCVDMITGRTLAGITFRLGGTNAMGMTATNGPAANSGSEKNGVAPASALSDNAYATGGGVTFENRIEGSFSGLSTELDYEIEVWSMGSYTTTDRIVLNGVEVAWPHGCDTRAKRKAAPGAMLFKTKATTGEWPGLVGVQIYHVNNPVLNAVRLTAYRPGID